VRDVRDGAAALARAPRGVWRAQRCSTAVLARVCACTSSRASIIATPCTAAACDTSARSCCHRPVMGRVSVTVSMPWLRLWRVRKTLEMQLVFAIARGAVLARRQQHIAAARAFGGGISSGKLKPSSSVATTAASAAISSHLHRRHRCRCHCCCRHHRCRRVVIAVVFRRASRGRRSESRSFFATGSFRLLGCRRRRLASHVIDNELAQRRLVGFGGTSTPLSTR
jgi:hypothetical protein